MTFTERTERLADADVFTTMITTISINHLVLGYLDGGTGSMMLQAAIAGALSMGFVIKTRWIQLKQIFASKVKNSD